MKFKTKFVALAAALLGLAGIAYAQVTIPAPSSMGTSDRVQVIPNGQVGPGNVYATLTQMRAWVLGGVSGHSGTPVLSSCGTGSPALGTGATDTAGRITVGTSATGCTLTFSTAYTSTPSCTVVSQTAYATTTPAYTVSTTAIAITQTSTSGNIYNYHCIGT